MKKVIALGDVHAPYQHKRVVKRALEVVAREKPDVVVQVGDLYDFYAQSRFPKRPGHNPGRELEDAFEVAQEFWSEVQRTAPGATCYQLLGNHCIRPLKLSQERCPDLYHLVEKSWKELFKFEGVSTLYDPRGDLMIDGVVYEHGWCTKPFDQLRENMRSTVFGHTHRPWIQFERIRGELLWEMNVGYLANPEHPALQYTQKKWSKWVHGVGVVESAGPRFIAL